MDVTVRLVMWFKTTIPIFQHATHRCGPVSKEFTGGRRLRLCEAAAQEAPASHTLSASGLSAGRSRWGQCTEQQELPERTQSHDNTSRGEEVLTSFTSVKVTTQQKYSVTS